MRTTHVPWAISAVVIGTLTGCESDTAHTSQPAVDASAYDATAHDASEHDATIDSSQQDATIEAGRQDAYPGDASAPDAFTPPLTTTRGVWAARSAQAFVDSVGVNTHIGYTDRNYWNFPQLQSAITELGVRHIRDGQPAPANHLNPQSTAGIVTTRMQALAATGVKATLISGYPVNSAEAQSYAREQLAVFKHLGTGIAAFEHTNEPDLFAARTDPQWAENLRAYLPVLWQERNADSATMHIPVLAPSVIEEFRSFAESLPAQRDLVTHCNVHPYPGGNPPESGALRALGTCRAFVGDVPVMATETGYHTAIHDTSGHNGVSATAQGLYIPRLFLEYFLLGYVRTHSYEMLDGYADPLNNQREAQFGLVRLDWSRKPAFIALKRLLTLLDDPGPDFTPSGLVLRVSDRNARVLVLQKRNGSFWIALWRPDSVFDLATKQDVAVATAPVTLTFESAPSRVTQHALRDPDPSLDITPADTAVTLDVGGEVVLLHVEGVTARLPQAPIVDHFDDLNVVASHSGVVIDRNPVRSHDFDNGLVQTITNGAHLTYNVDGLHDFALRGYFFCQGCLNHPLNAIVFQRSDNGTDFIDLAHDVVDRRPTMDAREIVTFVPQAPLPESTRFLRIVLNTPAPRLSTLTLHR